MLATQLIEARAQQEGCRQACMIGLSINEDTKLEKGKEKEGSAARSFMRSSSHVSSRDCVYHNVYYNPPFSTSAVTVALIELYYAVFVAYCYYISRPIIKYSLVS